LDPNLIRIFVDKQQCKEEAALVTIISSSLMKGGQPGTMILVDQFGQVIAGEIGDSMFQEMAAKEAQRYISKGLSRKVMLNSGDKFMEIFINVSCPADKLIIVGSGNMVQDLYQLALVVGYNITIIDNQPETLTRERFPLAHELLLGDIAELLKSSTIDSNTSIVLISHNHEYDEPALVAVVNSPARYIGILGNKRKVTAYFSKLNEMGVADELINRVHVPVGLDLGGQKTSEIALAIMAEILAVKYGRPGGFMSIRSITREMERHDVYY
jgi:xanthine dehydrogenase accessory factor